MIDKIILLMYSKWPQKYVNGINKNNKIRLDKIILIMYSKWPQKYVNEITDTSGVNTKETPRSLLRAKNKKKETELSA